MEQELTIKSSRNAGRLKLSESNEAGSGRSAEYLRVSLEDHQMSASCSRVYLYERHGLAAFFVDLASQWKGWAGEKKWNSVEDDFGLSCTSDGLGHVALRVKLKSGLDDDDWFVQTVIYIDSGQLEELAVNVKAFLYSERAS